ncbi:MAG: hypothetical protein QOK37_2202 [Thermoanaerobaculia bacterium]|nr:hypothetical protein [Thermoanaerobaculia bacterium]
MTTPVPPEVECEQEHAALKVSDVAAAAEFYTTKLGFKVAFMFGDPPNIAGLNLGNVQMFLEQGTPNPKGCSVYFVVGDADALFEFRVPAASRSFCRPRIDSMDCATTGFAIFTATSSRSVITCTTPALRSRSSASTFP